MGAWSHIPSLSTALSVAQKESTALSKMVTPVDTAPVDTAVSKTDGKMPDEESHTPEDKHTNGIMNSITHTMSSVLGVQDDLISTVAHDLTSVDVNVKAGGRVAVDGTLTTSNTVTFKVDRYTMLYTALLSFVAMELLKR